MKVFKVYFLLLFVLLMGNVTVALGQNRVLSGKVMDNLKEPLLGVSIQIAGTTMGTITSDDGTFQINVPTGKTITLHMSYVGYLTQKIEVKPGENNIVVYMQEDAIMLEEAVVVGYGTQKKVNLTGAITTVGSEKLENRVSHSLTNMLQGSVPGLNVTTSSGVPGSSASINVRGTTSINSSDPLVLIDGAVGDMSRVNPNDVESISVIKDASAAAVYGARAAFGVILITTKSGAEQDGKATVRYSGRLGWEAPTTSTDYEDTGYWSVYTINKFWKAENGGLYVDYTDYDMQQLLARVNDKTENPDRPWTVIDERNGRKQWVYYGNYDWWHMLYNDNRPVQQHNVSISGGNKDVKYMVSGAYNYQKGMLKENPDIFNKYNLRSKIDMRINKWANFTNNTSFYGSQYSFQGDGSVENTIAYGARHALACFPMKNPDGSWLYSTPYLNYKVANGRHIMLGEGSHRNVNRTNDFSNTSRLVITPIKPLSFTADFTYRLYQTRNTSRSNVLYYREYPDAELGSYATGAGANRLDESVNTRNYYSANVFANYDDTFNEVHHLSGVIGFNYETMRLKNISAYGENLSSTSLDDFNLVGQNSEGQVITGVDGSQNAYALAGFFGRINYDYAGRYLFVWRPSCTSRHHKIIFTVVLEHCGSFHKSSLEKSDEMLAVLREKADELEISERLLLLRQDILNLDLYGTIRAAISTFDTYNHIGPRENFEKAIEKAAFFMEKDGVFLFDLNTPYKHREVLADNVFDLEGPDATCRWENHYDEAEQTVDIRIGIHYLDTDERFEEHFKEYTYPLEYVEEVLKRYGFRMETVCDGETFAPLTEESQRYIITAIKEYTQMEKR